MTRRQGDDEEDAEAPMSQHFGSPDGAHKSGRCCASLIDTSRDEGACATTVYDGVHLSRDCNVTTSCSHISWLTFRYLARVP
ncbi:hypothetical protein BD309DRAFT_730925 [Dichomitus squalens]|nr:hypothetical protein BD309DRAFT_730925 [Dichomitus squalens]